MSNHWVSPVSIPIENVEDLFLEGLSKEQKCSLVQHLSMKPEYLAEVEKVQRGLPDIDQMVVKLYTQKEGGYTPMNLLARHGADAATERVRKTGEYPFWELYQYDDFWTDDLKAQIATLITDDTLLAELLEGADQRATAPENYDWEVEEDDVYKRITDEFLAYTIAWTIHQLSRIIFAMPPLSEECLVFRGVRTNLFLEDNEFVSHGFTSVSNNPESAQAFHEEGGTNYLYRMVLPEGSRVMPMRWSKLTMYAESEVVLPDGVKMINYEESDMQDYVLVDVSIEIPSEPLFDFGKYLSLVTS